MSNAGHAGGTSGGGILTSVVLPVVVGGLIGAGVIGGLVYSQTTGPEQNPASKQILVYGD